MESANNHIDDFGEGFLTDTLNFWKTTYPDVTLLGIHDSQEDADTVKIREVNGIKNCISGLYLRNKRRRH